LIIETPGRDALLDVFHDIGALIGGIGTVHTFYIEMDDGGFHLIGTTNNCCYPVKYYSTCWKCSNRFLVFPPVGDLVCDVAVGDADGFEVFDGTIDLSLLVGVLEEVGIDGTLGFADEFEFGFAVFVETDDAPVGIVVADDPGDVDFEDGRKFEVEEDVVIVVETIDEPFLHVGIVLDEVVEGDAVFSDGEFFFGY